MKMKQFMKSLSLVLILILILAACNQDENVTDQDDLASEDSTSNLENSQDTETVTPEVSDTNEANTDQTEELIEEQPVDPLEEQARFDAFLERLARTALEESPLTATFTLGDLEAEGLLDLAADIDHLDLEELYAQIDQMILDYEELLTIDKDLLTPDQQVNYELAKFNLSFAEESRAFMYMDHLIQPSSGVQVNFPLALMQIEFESRNELDAFVERVSKVPRLFDEVIAYEQERFEMGYGLPGHLYQEVADQIGAMIGQAEDFMMYLSFVDRVDAFESLSDEEREAYKADYLTLIRDEIFPAMERLKIQAEAMVSSSNTGSVSQLAAGKDYYESVVNYKTAGELDVEGLRAWAGEQMNYIIGDFQLLIQKIRMYLKWILWLSYLLLLRFKRCMIW